jgi:hypothetical protein
MNGSPLPVPFDSDAYRTAYGRINGMVVVGEGLADEEAHLSYAESWLGSRLQQVQPALTAACREALPIALSILTTLSSDMRQIGVDPSDVLATFGDAFQGSLERIGYETRAARRLLNAAAAAAIS